MQDRTYGDLFTLTSSLIGATTLAPDEQTQLASFINRRFYEAFNTSQSWPRYLSVSDERYVAQYSMTGISGSGSDDVNGDYALLGVWDSTETTGTPDTKIYINVRTYNPSGPEGTIIYETSSEVRIDTDVVLEKVGDKYIIFSSGTAAVTNGVGSTSDLPSVTGWSAVGGFSGTPKFQEVQLIPDEEYGKTTIGEPLRVHRSKPFRNDSVIEYDFYVDANGINILNIIGSETKTAFATYKHTFSPFTVTSDYYSSTVSVPSEFFNYIAHAAYADFLRVQNKQEEAIAEERVAQSYLDIELKKVDAISNKNTINKRFTTYVSRQSR